MIQKLIISLTLTTMLNGLVVAFSLPAQPLIAAEALTAQAAENQVATTQITTATLYLPAVFVGYCGNPFSYNETLRYNMEKIEVATAWQNCAQSGDITVAVVDTGIDLDHSDLQANIVAGQSFVVGASSPDDDQGHGTHAAGIVAGVSNNGGIIGVAPEAGLMAVKVLDSAGSGTTFDVANGIIWAVDNGADVINLSLGSPANSTLLKTAIDYAYYRGVLVIAAGGNCGDGFYFLNGCSYQDQPVYPAAYSNVMAVASTDSNDNQSSFSNQGSYIEIAAPGSYIYSTYPSGSYATMSGTSMAAPHVAGLAALVWSKNSALTHETVRARIRDTAEDLGTNGWDQQFGYGRIDAAAAIKNLQATSTTALANQAVEVFAAEPASNPAYIPGEILLKLQSGLTVKHVIDPDKLAVANVKVAGTIDQFGVQKLSLTAGQEQAMLSELRAAAGVEFAELNYVVTMY